MAEVERKLLNHYNITTLYPSEWPAEKDVDSEEDEVIQSSTARPIRRSKSRYSALERNASLRSSIPGSEKTSEGVENLVQKDEPDPLGSTPSVVQVLRSRGLLVEDDTKLRNRFLLSSTTFSPALFLSQVHNDASTDSLLQGLDFLSRSIEKKSASLKVLVESNFERFVRAKATIDNVYTEMRDQGVEKESAEKRPHSRHTSKSGGHARATSNPFSPGLNTNKALPSDKKKNALIKESEYGVQGIKGPLTEVAVKAEEVWGPALGGREREETLKGILGCVEKNRGLFEVGPSIQDCIKRKDYEMLPEEYARARRYAGEAKSITDEATAQRRTLSDAEVHQLLVTSRMWSDVEEQITVFKRDIWRRLADTHFTKQEASADGKPEEHMQLINILLELGVEDNPAWVWLLSRYDYLKNKITATSERSRLEIEVLRRRLALGKAPPLKITALHLRSAENNERLPGSNKIDSTKVIEFWDHVVLCMNALLSMQGGILAEIVEFWDTAASFIDGRAQRKLPIGPDGASRKHHRLSTDGVRDLQSGALELIHLMRESIFTLFTDPPLDDISALFSPATTTPSTPKTPLSAALSPMADRFKVDINNIPPPSPSRGEPWERYAFWPPHANSLSGVQYLSKILSIIGIAASEMATLSVIRENGDALEQLKSLVGGIRERCVQAICNAWNTDAEHCKVLEDWTRSAERKDLTNMPNRFMALESHLLSSMQKLLYVSDAMNKPGAADVVVPPAGRILTMVRSQFVTSLYKALSGMVENAEKLQKIDDDAFDADTDGLLLPSKPPNSIDATTLAIDPTNRSVRLLLTLSNLQSLRNEVVPQLISQFETNFTVTLADESKTIRDVLGQIDARLFQSYLRPISERLNEIIAQGINAPDWEPPTHHPQDAKPYVYTVLLSLVIVHTEVSTTASSLTSSILKYLLEQISQSLITQFRARPGRYSLPALMQATLDVEFLAQTLNTYTTDKASETQSAIYLALDERTDNDARMKLQVELGELRVALKRLREGTRGEFACFKRQKSHRPDGSVREGRPPSRP